ncbi:MAG: metallophosphoesterase [Clostridia bacterium]|nr:metallophosphoesterase [Clostridia bacterium]
MGKRFKKALAVILSLCMIVTLFAAIPVMTASADPANLKFGSDGKFKIVIFSDIQENLSDAKGIARLNGIMEQVLDYEEPELVVLLGDQTEMNIKTPSTDTDFTGLLGQILAPIADAGVPYAFVFGNHDNQSYYSGTRADKDDMLAVYRTIGDCRTTDPDPSLTGTGTCKIPIYSSDGSSVAFDLFMVDSNTYQDPITGSGGYDNPHSDQLAWLAANKDAGKNSLVFQHIPMPEIYNLVTVDAGGTKTYGGVTYAKSLNSNATGSLGEFPCPPYSENNTGEFAALQSMGGVLGVFTGHDHLNDFTGTYNGIKMTAVPGMTYFNYGDEAVRGYGVIELDESDLSTYDYHSVKFSDIDSITSPYAFNVDFSAGNAIETSGNASYINTASVNANSGSTVTYTFDSTLNRTVATFNGSSGYGYRLSETARNKMQDGYTFEILYKLPAAPSSSFDLASGMYNEYGIRLRYSGSGGYFSYEQSFEGDTSSNGSERKSRAVNYNQGDYSVSKTADTWVHLVAVWDPDFGSSGRMKAYLNGVYNNYFDPRANVLKFDANYEYYIGGNSNSSGNFSSGSSYDIAFVRFRDKVCSESEVAALYIDALTPSAGAVDGLYHPYDEIEYEDLLKNNLALDDEFTFGGGNILTYKATSPTYSAKLKFRWTVGTQLGIQFSFDRSGDNLMTYPFGVWVKKPTNEGTPVIPYGAWHLKPTDGGLLVQMASAPAEGDIFDIELGRLKVMENAASHAGEYYVYLKVNDVLVQETYSTTSAYGYYTSSSNSCHLSNELVFDDWGSYGNKISATPTGETYAAYDEIGYEDLHMDSASGALLPTGGRTLTSQNNKFYYTATSPTHSAIYKIRWVAGNDIKFQVHPGTYGSSNNFAYRIYDTNFVQRNPSLNSAIGYTIKEGNELDLEFARLMVTSGANSGKYYTYFKVDDTLIFEKYVAADDANTTPYLDDAVQMNLNDSSHYCYIKPYGAPEETSAYDALYYDYDEIEYGDLNYNGASLASETTLGNRLLSYNRTSPTYSAILRYRWKAVAGSKFQLSFDRKGTESAINYMFGVQLYAPESEGRDNNSIRLRPGLDDANAWVELTDNIETDVYYNVEFARLKVKSGPNTGKYHVYFKLDDVLIAESYVAANIVDESGNYTSSPSASSCYLSNLIYITFWGGGGADAISAIPAPPEPETYEDYDEVYYSNLYYNGEPVAAERSGSGKKYTYNKTSSSGSAILKLRWKAANPATQFQISFDRNGSNDAINYMFGVQLYSASEEHPNGRVWLRPGYGPSVDFTSPIEEGENYDIEFARLKVTNGENIGKYYMYFKMNGVLYAESYVAADVVDGSGNYTSAPNSTACQISNEIYITFWGGGGATITNPAYSETYELYDEVTYNDLLSGGNPVTAAQTSMSGNPKFAYNRTSPTYSVIFKYRWTAGADPHYVFYFDAWAASGYPFCLAVKRPNFDGLGAAAGANGAWHLDPSVASHIVQMSSPVSAGDHFDIEHARLKVATGPYKGQYYVYVKVDGELIYGYYYNGDNGDGTYGSGSKIGTFTDDYLRFTSSTSDNYISATPIPETYEEYDEIGYHDLLLDGSPLPSRTTAINNKVIFTYNRTAPTYSAIFKYRWIAGDPAKFSLSFDTNNTTGDGDVSYPFCAVAKYPNQSGYGATAGANGAWQIDPTQNGLLVNMDSPLTVGGAYDIEFGRLRVASGANVGKFYVYLKVDGVLIQSRYYEVNSDGTYNSTCLSNNIVFAIYSSNGNKIRAYGAPDVLEHSGIKCDFGGSSGSIDTYDFGYLGKVIINEVDISGSPEGIADFNNDGVVDVRDYVAMKKQLSPTNTYAKSGSLQIGMQEHLLEDATKTAAYIADATATIGASTYRLSMPIHNLYTVTSTNGVTVNSTNMAKFKAQVSALTSQGITDILYVTDSFILPYGYYNSSYCHHKTVPNPETDTENYIAWLTVNSLAFGELAEECPEIKYFEPFNEINLATSRFEKYGTPWNATTSEQEGNRYTVQEKAGIIADLCWYISKEVKAADPANQVTTPSICVGSHIGANLQSTFLNLLYSSIESGGYPTDNAVGDKRIDNYFTIVNIHTYPQYSNSSSTRQSNVNTIANDVSAVYTTMQSHYDGGSRVWMTETGVSIDSTRSDTYGADLITKYLNKINTNLTFIDTVIFYKIADISSSAGAGDSETYYGLFYSGDNATSSKRYAAKETAKAIYKFTHNGSTDYSALTSLRSRYA